MTRPLALDPDRDDDLPFPSPTEPPRHDPWPGLDAPCLVGVVTAAQRGATGPITVDLLLHPDRVEFGGYALNGPNTARLWRLLGIAVYLLGEGASRSPLAESGRGIAGWDLADRWAKP